MDQIKGGWDALQSWGLPATIALILATYLGTSALYSLTLHPLARFPGPWWTAVSRIPFWVACVQGKQIEWMHNIHLKYGPVVRFGPNDVSYVDKGGEAWKAIHGVDKGTKEFVRAAEWFVVPYNGVYGINSVPDHDTHRRYRQVFSPAFSERALRSQEPLFRRHIDMLMATIKDSAVKTGEPVDMVELLQCTTFDIMGDLTFGQPLGLLESRKYSKWLSAVFDSIRVIPIAQLIQYYPLLDGLFKLLEPKVVKEMKYQHFKYSADRVDLRLKRGSQQPDIWNLVLSEGGDSKLSLDEMHTHGDVFLLAGSETTGTAMAALMSMLMENPDKFALLKKEIRTSFAKVQDITMETAASLKYLHSCIQEALRLHPPAPIGVPRVVSEGGRVILERWVAPGTRVSVHHYATYHSPLNFAEPDSFVPERWLAAEGSAYAADDREAWQPFSYGPRACLGQNMAMHEMRLLLACLFYRFDVESCAGPGDAAWTDQRAYALWEKGPLMCRLREVD